METRKRVNGYTMIEYKPSQLERLRFNMNAKKIRERIEQSQKTGKKLTEQEKQEILDRFQERYGNVRI